MVQAFSRPMHKIGFVLLICTVLLSLLAFNNPSYAQSTDEQTLLRQAVVYLGQQLGVSINVIDGYTVEPMTFEDSSLGCPAAGKTYVTGSINGYRFLITYKSITYDIHLNADGTQAAICNNADIKQSTGISTFRTTDYTVGYPERWTVTQRVTDVYIGPSASPVCAEPGMIVQILGQVGTKTADVLLDEYLSKTPSAVVKDQRINIRQIGRSVLYTAPCTNGASRQHRLTIFVAYGEAYQVLQYAPQNVFNQWADVFLQTLSKFSPSAGNATSGVALEPPAVSPLAAIAHIFAGNVYRATLVDWPGIALTTGGTPEHGFAYATISPTGQEVAFVDPYQGQLLVTGIEGTSVPVVIAKQIAPQYPIAWKADGSQIAYVSQYQDKPVLMAVNRSGEAPAILVALPDNALDCPASASNPADRLFDHETGIQGNRVLLWWAADGTLYFSLRCNGQGLGKLGVGSGQLQTLHPTVRRVAIAMDSSVAIGLEEAQVVRIDLTSGTTSPFALAHTPDQWAWNADGTVLYYSTVTPKIAIKLDQAEDKDRIIQEFGVFPYEMTENELVLYQFNVQTGVVAKLYEATGRGMASIQPSPDGAGILLTIVQSNTLLVEAYNNNISGAELLRQAPAVQAYWWDNKQQKAYLLAYTHSPVWGRLGSAPAPTPTGSSASATQRGIATATPAQSSVITTPISVPMTPTAPTPMSTVVLAPPPTNTPAAR